MLFLDTSSLSESAARCWQFFLRFAVRQLDLDLGVETGEELVLDEVEEFVFVSSSQALSCDLLVNYKSIYLAPQNPPRLVARSLYQRLLAEKDAGNTDFADENIQLWLRTLVPAKPRVTLISSVFSADVYLSGFLANMESMEDYDGDEHFLIRPGSPGNEHFALVNHVRHHPGAVYINLKHDPGLYQVWNLGVRLATASYISNANLDDRRAPDQLVRLCNYLDHNSDVAVASCRLRVTDQPDLSWKESVQCSHIFGNVQGGRYTAQNLVRQTDDGVVSRNLPHCMPVWRRSLHADYGEFDEKNFGPSADWEFWLRAGVGGESFYFQSEALGLYLHHPESYWHRQEESNQEHFDRRILKKYAGLLNRIDQIEYQPLAMDIALANRLLKAQDYGGGICWLLRSVRRGWRMGQASQELLAKLCRQFLGCDSLETVASLFEWSGKSDDLHLVMIDLVHRFNGSVEENLYRPLDIACNDWYEMTGERLWLLLRALLAHLAGQRVLEAVQLKTLLRKDPCWFWEHLQSVYRFVVPLNKLVSVLGCMKVATELDSESGHDFRLVYFPDYRSSNNYTELLYRSINDRGGLVTAAATVEELEALSPLPGRKNVVHLHWIQAVFKDCSTKELADRIDNFLKLLDRLQWKGFSIYWTVHNRLSHGALDPHLEIEFRSRLAAQVDRIYLHHPLAIELLEWLDQRDKVYLVEHGCYDTPTFIDEDPQKSRRMIGVNSRGVVLCHLGLIRDYKGLEETFPVILESLGVEKNIQFVVAGRIVGTSLKKWLQKQRHSGLFVKGERLSQVMLERYMHAADFGFLSYRDILTSGSLFHWFTCGRPVIAPAKGTIPSYVVDGWNGFLYTDENDLRDVIQRATSLSIAKRRQMGVNALTVANVLKWKFS